jgi:hypothetical protein
MTNRLPEPAATAHNVTATLNRCNGDHTMAKASLRFPHWGQVLFLGVGLLALGVLITGPGNPAVAQKPGTKAPVQKSKSSGETELPGLKGGKGEPKVFNDIMVPTYGGVDQVAYINAEIEKGWKENKIDPADRCSDYEFIRRASLDLIGRIAKVSEIQKYMSDPPEKRRSLLVNRLLESEEFPNHFANLWTNMLLTRSGGKVYRNQMHLWLYDHFDKKEANWKTIAAELIKATGKSNDNGAVNFILAHLGEELPAKDRKDNGRFDMVPVTSRAMRLFMGLRIQCAQCHDHPFADEWRQHHFWGVNAFFRQVDAPNGRPNAMMKKKGPGPNQPTLVDNPDFNAEGLVPYERRNGLVEFQKAVFLDGRKGKAKAGQRREELAEMVTSSEYFAKTFINRMWGHFFGRSFTKDPDDFGEHSPVSHPALLEKLAKDWASKGKYDPRTIIRWICNSRAYGLSSVANKTNDKSDAEPFFSRMLLKAMTPEQLFESLMVATDAKVGQDKDKRRDLREKWLEKLIVNFGDDEGSEGSFNGTVVQALLMMNGQEINNAITDREHGTVAVFLKRKGVTPRTAMHDLYMAALNRPPSDAEYSRILNPRMVNLPRLNPRRDMNFYHAFYQDLFWALLNSNEFILNH